VLALSWSPLYCAEEGRADREQCGGDRKGFVVHGLWPLPDKSGGNGCTTDHALDSAALALALTMMPTARLAEHEWRKHGSCSDLAPASYFRLMQFATQRAKVPTELVAPQYETETNLSSFETRWQAVNPGLDGAALAVVCASSSNRLKEVRLCTDAALRWTRCPGYIRDSCSPYRSIRILPVSR
jgi:ribonuclease T2